MSDKRRSSSTQFQFRYGAIKSKSVATYAAMISLFQFRYGAIKSGALKHIVIVDYNFNSAMVQLKETQRKMRT